MFELIIFNINYNSHNNLSKTAKCLKILQLYLYFQVMDQKKVSGTK